MRQRFAPDDLHQRFLGQRQLAIAHGSLADCKQGDAQWKQALASSTRMPTPRPAETADAHALYARLLFNCGEYKRGFEVAGQGLAKADRAKLPTLSPAAETKPLRALLVCGGCCHDYAKQQVILRDGIQARANVQVSDFR